LKKSAKKYSLNIRTKYVIWLW